MTEFQEHRRVQPILCMLSILLHMNMRRLVAITCINLKAKATNPQYNWHLITLRSRASWRLAILQSTRQYTQSQRFDLCEGLFGRCTINHDTGKIRHFCYPPTVFFQSKFHCEHWQPIASWYELAVITKRNTEIANIPFLLDVGFAAVTMLTS